MGALVKTGKKDLNVRLAAMLAVQHLQQKDYFSEMQAIFEFVRDEIRYVRDVRNVETLSTPDKTLEFKQGDCDDKSVLLAAMLESIGHPTRFVAVGFKPDDYVHVFVETKLGQKWIALDSTEPVPVGWRPKNVKSQLIFFN
jgi:transglutaminase-like putative cysteine protease